MVVFNCTSALSKGCRYKCYTSAERNFDALFAYVDFIVYIYLPVMIGKNF